MTTLFSPSLLLVCVLALGAIVFLSRGLVIVRQSEVMVIERLGSYSRTLESGINLIIPFIDRPRTITMTRYQKANDQYVSHSSEETRIDRRETVMNYPAQSVVTTDNVTVTIDGALYFQIIDPRRAVYEVENISQAVEVLAKTTLRSVVGKMELDNVFESRDEVNGKILTAMETATDKWGIKITRVEVQDIRMPEDVENAMRLQMTAERERRATVTKAEGEKAAAIAKAQGQRESEILTAEGDQQAAILRATGEKESIELVVTSLGDSDGARAMAVDYLLRLQYFETLPKIGQNGERIYVPYDTSSLVGAMGMLSDVSGSAKSLASAALVGNA